MDPWRKPSLQCESGKMLGRGQYGTVTLGFLNHGCKRTPVAVKTATGSNGAMELRREKKFLDQLNGCDQVIRCYGDATSTKNEEDGNGQSYKIFLEFAPEGSLRDYLKLRPMHEDLARLLTRSMLRGLAHIHLHGVTHCDIKPENVMLWSTSEVKVIDFGLALPSCESIAASGSSYRGTAYYLAPECVARSEYRAPADVWALGCTLAEMLMGKPARAYLDNVADSEYLSLVGKGDALPEIPKHMSELGRNFLWRCFEVDTRKRWTAEMLLRHPYIAQSKEEAQSSSSSSSSSRAPKLRRFHPHQMLIAK